MRKFITLIFGLLAIIVLFSCATGNAIVTGTVRPAILPEEVTIYTEEPVNYEVIGVVSASSSATGISQSDLNYAVAELKKQAAKIGANGIILGSVSSSSKGAVLVGNVVVNDVAQNVSGKAIYVEK